MDSKKEENPTRLMIEVYGVQPEEIAFRLGVSIGSVNNWKMGRVHPLPFFERKLWLLLRRKQAN